MTPAEQRERLHVLVLDAWREGPGTRSEAMVVVAERENLRAGHVAAAYWRVEREISERRRREAAPRQLTLDGPA